ncbi:MAG: hypothetical protein AAGE01_13470 [Pseudomonadota bacterium]
MAKKKFEEALSTIKDAVVDLSQLNVRTFVGSITVEVDANGDPDWDNLMKKAISTGKVMMASSTTIRVDGDCDHFEDPDQMTDGLREAHRNAIEAGHTARKAIVDMISDKVKKLIKPA